MFRSKSKFIHVKRELAGAFLLALIVTGVLGITHVSAARSTTNLSELVLLGSSNSCVAGIHSSDYYLRQEETVLRHTTQSNWNAAESASLNCSISTTQASH